MDFIEREKDEKLIALIMEGTRIADDDIREEGSEELVSKESMKIVSTTNRLVLADFNFKDVDRLRTFLKVAKDNNRKFVGSDYKGRDKEFVGRHNTWHAQEIVRNES